MPSDPKTTPDAERELLLLLSAVVADLAMQQGYIRLRTANGHSVVGGGWVRERMVELAEAVRGKQS
jgi:hypothetical protein